MGASIHHPRSHVDLVQTIDGCRVTTTVRPLGSCFTHLIGNVALVHRQAIIQRCALRIINPRSISYFSLLALRHITAEDPVLAFCKKCRETELKVSVTLESGQCWFAWTAMECVL